MLKLNEANRRKVMELSHVYNGKFWGIWERCMFLMMAPLFSRYELHSAMKENDTDKWTFARRKLLAGFPTVPGIETCCR